MFSFYCQSLEVIILRKSNHERSRFQQASTPLFDDCTRANCAVAHCCLMRRDILTDVWLCRGHLWELDLNLTTWTSKLRLHFVYVLAYESKWPPCMFLCSDTACLSGFQISEENGGNQIFISPLPFPLLIPRVCSALSLSVSLPWMVLQMFAGQEGKASEEVVDSHWADMTRSEQRDH